ncbi:hypothetical protein [Aeromonas veronii]|uniref:hypothetical protein n=1 Tax=Aeromonas veronii TaxID=654 RepID=UPI001302344A|nr:hypothetical protein [Aeromonas veronii]KAE9622559.1 hypothetical protein GO627_20755 [Aeromonas veronii]
MHLVSLAFDGHGGTGELVLGPDRAGGHGTRTSCDLDAKEGGLLQARGNGHAATGDHRLDGGALASWSPAVWIWCTWFPWRSMAMGEPVSSRWAPAVPVATVPGQAVIWMVWLLAYLSG